MQILLKFVQNGEKAILTSENFAQKNINYKILTKATNIETETYDFPQNLLYPAQSFN